MRGGKLAGHVRRVAIILAKLHDGWGWTVRRFRKCLWLRCWRISEKSDFQIRFTAGYACQSNEW
jgi:hypothetical protein